MIDPEMRRQLHIEMAKMARVILSGSAGTNTMITENIENLYPGMGTITERPIMHPYGFASRAPAKTIQVTARQGEHIGNMVVLGHRDSAKPDVEVGESVAYSMGGYEVYIRNGKITLAKDGDEETAVVGDTLSTFLKALLDAIIAHTHTGNLGYPTGAPLNSITFTQLKTENLDNDKILAKDGGRF